MPTRIDWMPYALAERNALFINVRAKIDGYAAVLPLTAAQVTRIKELCDTFTFAYSIAIQEEATLKGLFSWRDAVFAGKPVGKPVMDRPMFSNDTPPAGATLGVVAEFRKLMAIVKAAPGFTASIGDDLTIMTPQHAPKILDEIIPKLTVTATEAYGIRIAGSLQGMDAMRVEMRRKGSETWELLEFLTSLPETVVIRPTSPGDPESIDIRGVFLKKNKLVGLFSQVARVTISAD